MGLLDSFERGLDRAVNGAFAKTFRSGIQPVEIASALRREIDTHHAVVSRDRILAPNTLQVALSPADEKKMAELGSALQAELMQLVTQHAKKQGYSFAGPLSITITADSAVPTGTISVSSHTAEAREVTWNAVVDVDGRRHTLTRSRTVIGRGTDADITVNDSNTSRKHVEVLWDGRHGMMRDLGSTNGSHLNGVRAAQGTLEDGSVIRIGRTDITFRVIPTSTGPRASRTSSPASPQIFDQGEYR